MPKFHTDVFWDLGKEISLSDTFSTKTAQQSSMGQKPLSDFQAKV